MHFIRYPSSPTLLLVFLLLIGLTAEQSVYAQADTTRLLTHLEKLTRPLPSRDYAHPEVLNHAADYIASQLRPFTDSLSRQWYEANGGRFQNVIASFGTEHQERIIVGAHYDVCGEQAGADDNASGVAGLLELARMLAGKELNVRIDLVAYSLAEPPYFRTEWMGSYQHAKWLHEQNIPVRGMLCLEMIGYFSDEKGSQDYPFGPMSWFYGKKGDYISLVRKFGGGSFARQFCRDFQRTKAIRTKNITAPARLPGIDFSDHLNYWKFGYSALMITDTAFYRNKNYHKASDTLETLDLVRMAQVIDGVLQVLLTIS